MITHVQPAKSPWGIGSIRHVAPVPRIILEREVKVLKSQPSTAQAAIAEPTKAEITDISEKLLPTPNSRLGEPAIKNGIK